MTDVFHGLFEWHFPLGSAARPLVIRGAIDRGLPRTVPCLDTGRPLQVATLEVSDRGVCPACMRLGAGGCVSFVADLRPALACRICRKLVWIAGA